MTRFYQPDLGSEPDSPFAGDAKDKLDPSRLLVGHE